MHAKKKRKSTGEGEDEADRQTSSPWWRGAPKYPTRRSSMICTRPGKIPIGEMLKSWFGEMIGG